MTALNGRALVRLTSAHVRVSRQLRPLIVEAFAGYVVLRPKGTRQRYAVDWESIWSLGAKKAARERAEGETEGKTPMTAAVRDRDQRRSKPWQHQRS